MKNKEYFKDQIIDLLCEYLAIAVDINTGKPCACESFGCANCAFAGDESCPDAFVNWLNQEHKEHVLTYEEKQYLENVIRPFKKRIKSIKKMFWSNDYTYIQIAIDCLWGSEFEYINLPVFVISEMYKGMELGKQYTLKDLGLFEKEEKNENQN